MCNQTSGKKMLDAPEVDVLKESLSTEEIATLAACFDTPKRTVRSNSLREKVKEVVLPKVSRRMGWASARCVKLRANDVASVSRRYNSDFHRDRHLYGLASNKAKVAWTNLSCVVYLDEATFEYVEGSAAANPPKPKIVQKSFDPGTMIIFPSSLVHKAKDDPSLDTTRRTIIVFDIEDADTVQTVPHAILCLPTFTQKPAFHSFLSETQVQFYVLRSLFTDSMYAWRFIPQWCRQAAICRVHWQVTTPHTQEKHDSRDVVPLNTSIYMTREASDNVTYYDFRSFFGFVLRLIDAYTTRIKFTR